MESMPAPTALVTVGVDTHLDLHVAAVLDHTGRLLGTQAFPASTRGYVALVTWPAILGSASTLPQATSKGRSEPSRPVVDRTEDVPKVDSTLASKTAWSRRSAGQRCGSVRGDLDRRNRFQAAQGVLLLTLTGTKPPQPPGADAEGGR